MKLDYIQTLIGISESDAGPGDSKTFKTWEVERATPLVGTGGQEAILLVANEGPL